MKIKATKTITTEVELTIRPSNNYPYAIIAPSGETVGWLKTVSTGIYHTHMINTRYKPNQTIFSAKDFMSKEQTNG